MGFSSATYGTLTVFRQNSLTLDGVIAYDPMGASYAFSPIGFAGIACGVGNTEVCRFSNSVKYRVNIGQARVAALWQFGGYEQNNPSQGAYQVQVGGDVPNLANGTLSFDAIYSYVRDAVALSLGPGSNDANGTPIPPFLPQNLTATISDNSSIMLLAKYTNGPLKLYAGYERIQFTGAQRSGHSPSPISAEIFMCDGCAAFNSTDINNTAFGVNGLGNKILQVMWAGGRFASHRKPRCDGRLLPLYPELVFRHRRRQGRALPTIALPMCRHVRRGLRRYRLAVCAEVGPLFRYHVHPSERRIGERPSSA